MEKSQETQQLAVEMSGKRGFGGYHPYYGFFLRRRVCPKRQVGAELGQLHLANLSRCGEFILVYSRIWLIGGDENHDFRLFRQPLLHLPKC